MSSRKKTIAIVLAATIALYGLFALLDIWCPFRALFGIPCAGCGMTRAWKAVFQWDIPVAFHHHPLFWMVPFIPLPLLAKNKRTWCAIVWTPMAILFIAMYFFRLFTGILG